MKHVDVKIDISDDVAGFMARRDEMLKSILGGFRIAQAPYTESKGEGYRPGRKKENEVCGQE